MVVNTRLLLGIIFAFLLLEGCTHVSHIQPNPNAFPIDRKQFPDVSTSNTVIVRSTQKSTEEIRIGKVGRAQFFGNLSQWTDAAVIHAERALRDAGVSVGSKGTKELNLSITSVVLDFGWWSSPCITQLNAETGDGYSQRYESTNNASAGVVYLHEVACDGSLARAVIKMLNDPNILEYLQR